MWLVQSDSFSQILSHAYMYVCVCVTFGLANVMNYILLCLFLFFLEFFVSLGRCDESSDVASQLGR